MRLVDPHFEFRLELKRKIQQYLAENQVRPLQKKFLLKFPFAATDEEIIHLQPAHPIIAIIVLRNRLMIFKKNGVFEIIPNAKARFNE